MREVLERLVEKSHRVQVVAERTPLQRAELQDLVPIGKILERVMKRQRNQPRAKRLRQLLEPRHHLLQKIVIVQAPADLLGQREVRLEQTLLEAI